MMADYLFELGTEELPATHIERLRQQLENGWEQLLKSHHVDYQQIDSYATPRRLVLLTRSIAERQRDQHSRRMGPWYQQAYDAQNNPTKAALGFAQSCAVSLDTIDIIEEQGKQRLSFTLHQKGKETTDIIPILIQQLLKKLHLPQSMRWGSHRFTFVRPVRWICSMLDAEHVPIEMFGIESSTQSYGHRSKRLAPFVIAHVQGYLEQLEQEGGVIVDQKRRRQMIVDGVQTIAKQRALTACYSERLLEELTYMVESPYPLLCSFDQQFLSLPDQVLKATMVKHQKYIYLVNQKQRIEPYMITISNIEDKTGIIVEGNQRVLRPRLSDAAFFLEQDYQCGIQAMAGKLDKVIFEASLGSMAQRSQRLERLVVFLAQHTGDSEQYVRVAAQLCKADLVSGMVGEFPEVQGVMGNYYAAAVDQPDIVCQAIEEHYRPRFASDILPSKGVPQLLALADRLDVITGFFLIGKKATGDKDPYGLRRAALAIIRIASTIQQLPSLETLIAEAVKGYQKENIPTDIVPFFHERMRSWYGEQKVAAHSFAAVAATDNSGLYDFDQRIKALESIEDRGTLSLLGALTKRIGNIIDVQPDTAIDQSLLVEAAEQQLFQCSERVQQSLSQAMSIKDYRSYLQVLTEFQQPVDNFFAQVMVNSDDQKLKANRMALLSSIHQLCTRIIDISQLNES